MTEIPDPKNPGSQLLAKYDAWNRLAYAEAGGHRFYLYKYDGLNRRTERSETGVVTQFYYSNQWQVLEEQIRSSQVDEQRQYVWGTRYVDDLVLRDSSIDTGTDGSSGTATSGGGHITERLYALQDANFNVVALVDESSQIMERYVYTPYGEATYLDRDFMPLSVQESAFENEYLYTGRRVDRDSGLQLNRNRYYHQQLGRWVSRDPIGYEGGWNHYAYTHNQPLRQVDPDGLFERHFPTWPFVPSELPGFPSIPDLLPDIRLPELPSIEWHQTLCASVAALIYGALLAIGETNGARFWRRFTMGDGSPLQLTQAEMTSIVNNDSVIQNAIDRKLNNCQALNNGSAGTDSTLGHTLESPWLTSLGGVSLTLSHECDCPCLNWTVDLRDRYDWRSNLISNSGGHRSYFGEGIASAFDLIQIATRCTARGIWKEYDITGSLSGRKCPPAPPTREDLASDLSLFPNRCPTPHGQPSRCELYGLQ